MFLAMWMAATVANGQTFGDWLGDQPRNEPEYDTIQSYRTSADAFWEIGRAMDAHPDTARAEAIGTSIRDVPIWAFHVGPPPQDANHSVLVFANLHALEWIGTDVAVDLLLELIESPPVDVAVTVVPIANPDGREKVENDLRLDRTVYRRGNAIGVDLNRDWAINREPPAVWRKIIPAYYGHSEEPLSQPETRAIDALVARNGYTRAASLHSFGGYLYYPWSGAWERPPDHADFVTLGRAMEAAQGRRAYRTRQLSHWGFFFRACGSEIDHLYGTYGTRAFLVEMTRSGIRPLRLRRDLKTHFRWYNPRRSTKHRERGVIAMRTLIDHPTLDGESDGVEPPELPFGQTLESP